MARPKKVGRTFTGQQLGTVLIVALALMYLPLGPFGVVGVIADLMILAVAILLLVR